MTMHLKYTSERIDQRRKRRYGRMLTVFVGGWGTKRIPHTGFREAFTEQYASLGGTHHVDRIQLTWDGEEVRVDLWKAADKPSLIPSRQVMLDSDPHLTTALTGAFSLARDLQLDYEERTVLAERATAVAENLRQEARSRAKAACDYDARMAELKAAYDLAYEAAVEALGVEATEDPTYEDGTTEDPRVVKAALKAISHNPSYPWARFADARQHLMAKDIV